MVAEPLEGATLAGVETVRYDYGAELERVSLIGFLFFTRDAEGRTVHWPDRAALAMDVVP